MTVTSLRAPLAAFAAAVAALLVSPLTAVADVVVRGPEGSGPALGVLARLAPVVLWGAPLAYGVFTVVSLLPRRRAVQKDLAAPRDATFIDRLSLGTDPGEGW